MTTITTFSAPTCRYCGAWHSGTCPRIKAIEYHPDGSVRRVELHPLSGSVAAPGKEPHE